MMLVRKKTALGLILCTLVLSASVPLLLGIESTPKAVFRGDMVAVSQINSSVNLNESLADEMRLHANVQAASPEITCFCVIRNQPVIVRGVNLDDFLELENSTLMRGEVTNPERYAVIGRKLADRLSLDIGDRFLLTGSSASALFQLEIDAFYKGNYSEDELLVPLSYARKMAGLADNTVLFIRVRTTNQSALVEELVTQEQPVMVTDTAGTSTPVNVNISEEDRIKQQLAIKYLDTAEFKSSNGSYVSMFVQEGSNSIRIVVSTFIVLDGALAFIGSAAIISRAIIERSTEMGILSAIGANRRKIQLMIVRDVFLISVTASIIGTLLGYGVVTWVENHGLLLMFGESIHAVIDSTVLISIFAISVIIHVSSALLVGTILTKARPRSLMQETDVVEREEAAPLLESLLEVGG
jgi:ABC-type lipoprotein release transport system permease subunit